MNQEIVDKLFKIADLLEAQGASPFRVNAYRNAANMVDSLNLPVSEIVERKGIDGLLVLPGIGEGIARSIVEYVVMGRMSRLESLQGGHDPVVLFETIPGIGSTLAHRIIERLHNVPGTGWWCIFMEPGSDLVLHEFDHIDYI